jgi:hypothetical protein
MADGASPLPTAIDATSLPRRRRKSPYRRAPVGPPTHGAAMLTRLLRSVRLDTIDNGPQVGGALRRTRQEL